MHNPTPVCLVADTVDEHRGQSVDNRTLEFTEEKYLASVIGALKDIGHPVLHLESPKELAAQANNLNESIVLPLWSGIGNRSRRTFVPSTCESLGLAYVGADAYTSIVCQDKDLSKTYAKRYGIGAPAGTVIDAGEEFAQCARMSPPFVVKPLLEGGSIGIDQKAFCQTWKEVIRQVSVLHDVLGCPVLVEEFLEGEEISVCLMGRSGESARFGAVRLDVDGYDLAKGIWSMEMKKTLGRAPVNVPVTDEIEPKLERDCRALFESFEKIDYMRIDGRLTKDGFKLIELTPDVHLGPNASFAQAMVSTGLSYNGMWRELIDLGRSQS